MKEERRKPSLALFLPKAAVRFDRVSIDVAFLSLQDWRRGGGRRNGRAGVNVQSAFGVKVEDPTWLERLHKRNHSQNGFHFGIRPAHVGPLAALFVAAMGLCKCPKRKVTNLFCFEHRVNVCEHCIITNHTKCIVQSYLQWLQDSDYNPNCLLCNTLLATKDTARLICYDLFHWSCLNEMASQLPKNTAPAGYQCPSCQGAIFPPANLVSPVASALREKLSTVNWARAGLGLPLIDETEPAPETESLDATDYTDWSSFSVLQAEESPQPSSYSPGTAFASPPPQSLNNGGVQEHHTVIAMNALAGDPVTMSAASSPRKVYDTREGGAGRASDTRIDFDEDKYRRRPALGWLAQVLKNRFGSRRQPRSLMQKFVILLLIGGIGFLTLVVVMMKLGRASADGDPNLDPMLNPNIRVGRQ